MQESGSTILGCDNITPFWRRIPRFFLFPLQKRMLLVLVPLSLAALLDTLIPAPKPFDFLIVEGFIWLAALRHAFNVMDRTAKGLLSPDRYERAPVDPERVNLPWKMIAVIIFWGFIIGSVSAASRSLGVIVNLFFTLAFPASVMALSASNSLGQAVNPLLWIKVIRSIGKAYLILFVFLLLLSGGAAIAIPMLTPLLRSWLALPLINFVFLYFNLIMFNMMGYVLYQYHRTFGLRLIADGDEEKGEGEADPQGEIARRIAAGDLGGAIDIAYEQQRLDPENIDAHERYLKLLLLADRKDRALSHGHRYLAMLLSTGRGEQAVALFRRMRELDETFAPDDLGQVLPLARAARGCDDHSLALALMDGFDVRNSRHPDVPGMHLLSARIFGEDLREIDRAQAMLKDLRIRFPGHPLAGEAEVCASELEHHEQALARMRMKAVQPG